MKFNKEWFWYLGYILIGVIILALGFCLGDSQQYFYLLAYPFIYLGRWLRYLLLINITGAVFGYIFYIILSLAPVIIGLIIFIKNKRISLLDSCFLIILSTYLFYANYMFINPNLFEESLNDLILSNMYAKSIMLTESGLAFIFYAVIIVYLTLKVYLSKKVSYVSNHLAILLMITLISFTYLYFDLSLSLTNILDKGQNIEAVQIIKDIITSGLISVLVVKAGQLITSAQSNILDKKIINISKTISLLSLIMLIESLSFDIVTNILYLALGKSYSYVTYHFSFPLLEIIITFVFIGLSKYFSSAQKIKEENDLTV